MTCEAYKLISTYIVYIKAAYNINKRKVGNIHWHIHTYT